MDNRRRPARDDDAPSSPLLERAAARFAAAAALPPFVHECAPGVGRRMFDDLQSAPVAQPAVDEEWILIEGGPTGVVPVRIIRPPGLAGLLPVVIYLHGEGWTAGDARSHDRLVRELAVGARAAVVFPEYSLSPEVRYPIAIEQNYAVAQWVVAHGARHLLDGGRVAVAGDSAGGNLAVALTLMAKRYRDVELVHQVLFYPVTDASFSTASYRRFARGFHLQRSEMQWYWDQYVSDRGQRAEITASPLRATVRQLSDLPPALVITADHVRG